MPFYRASELFTLRPVPPTLGKPAWMNLRAVPRAPWAGEPEALRGPGIYGMFHDDRLVYVGLYAGKAERPFGGSVLERWEKHVTYQTLRSPYVTFARRHLKHLHALAAAEPNGPIETIVAMLALNGDESPLLQRKGGSLWSKSPAFRPMSKSPTACWPRRISISTASSSIPART